MFEYEIVCAVLFKASYKFFGNTKSKERSLLVNGQGKQDN